MNIRIDHSIKTPVYLQIASRIKEQILSGEISRGGILPSERALAGILGVHRNTVVRAYSELKDQHLIESRQGVGYVASYSTAMPLSGQPAGKPKKVSWANLIKDEFLDMEVTFDDLFQRFGGENTYSLGSGIATVGIYNEQKIAADITELITAKGRNQYFYSPYKGDKFLRQKLVSFLSTKGISATTGQIQILTETNQALDFLVMLLIKPGDTVILGEPVSPDTYRTMELAGAVIRTVPLGDDGIDCCMLEEAVRQYMPKFIYVSSSFDNPTGTILPLEKRRKIVEISERYRIPVIEEDEASELVYEGNRMPPLKSFDTTGNVIYIYSFSLTFVPGLSLAFVTASRDVIRSLSYLVSVRMVATDWLSQNLVARYLDDGTYYGVLRDFCENYGQKRDIVCSHLDSMKDLGVEYTKPRGGVYIWCRLPEGIDSKEFVSDAYSRGLALIPGYIFYPFRNGGRDRVRINFSYETPERLTKGMEVFRQLIEERLAHQK